MSMRISFIFALSNLKYSGKSNAFDISIHGAKTAIVFMEASSSYAPSANAIILYLYSHKNRSVLNRQPYK